MPRTSQPAGNGRTITVALALALAVVAASCSESADDASNESTSTSAGVAATSATTTESDTDTSGSTTSTTQEPNATTTTTGKPTSSSTAAPAVDVPGLRLDTEGLTSRGSDGTVSDVRFGTSEAETVTAISAVLGRPTGSGAANEECPLGPATYADYREILLTFTDSRFVGWTLRPEADSGLATIDGIGAGSTVAELKRAYPSVNVTEDSTLGIEFFTDELLFGLLTGTADSDTILDLWAGETCTYR